MPRSWPVSSGPPSGACSLANLSLSSKSETLFPFFHEVVDKAYFRNVHLVSAANNVPGLSYPSLFSTVYSVAAHAIADPRLVYYNPRPPVEFGAWGVDVPIAWKDGGSTVATGNSFAAPHIAGLVACILSAHPGLTSFEVKAVLAAIAEMPPPIDTAEATVAAGAARPEAIEALTAEADRVARPAHLLLARASFSRACSRAWRSMSRLRAFAMSYEEPGFMNCE